MVCIREQQDPVVLHGTKYNSSCNDPFKSSVLFYTVTNQMLWRSQKPGMRTAALSCFFPLATGIQTHIAPLWQNAQSSIYLNPGYMNC